MKTLFIIMLLGSLAQAKEGLNPKAKCIGKSYLEFIKAMPLTGPEITIKDHRMTTTVTWPDKSFCIIIVQLDAKGIITEEAETGNCDYGK